MFVFARRTTTVRAFICQLHSLWTTSVHEFWILTGEKTRSSSFGARKERERGKSDEKIDEERERPGSNGSKGGRGLGNPGEEIEIAGFRRNAGLVGRDRIARIRDGACSSAKINRIFRINAYLRAFKWYRVFSTSWPGTLPRRFRNFPTKPREGWHTFSPALSLSLSRGVIRLRPLHKTGITQPTYRGLNEPNNCSYRLRPVPLVNLFCLSSFPFILPFREWLCRAPNDQDLTTPIRRICDSTLTHNSLNLLAVTPLLKVVYVSITHCVSLERRQFDGYTRQTHRACAAVVKLN